MKETVSGCFFSEHSVYAICCRALKSITSKAMQNRHAYYTMPCTHTT